MGYLLLIGSMELGICIRQSPDFAGMNASSQTCQKRERVWDRCQPKALASL